MTYAQRPVTITADHRERHSGIISIFENDPRVSLKLDTLPIGDYQIGDGLFVERKSAADFLNSIIDKRLFQQVDAIKESGVRSIHLIEGDVFRVRPGFSDEAIAGALSYIACFENLRMVTVGSVSETPLMLRTLAHHAQYGLMGGPPAMRPATPKTLREQQEWLLVGLPGLGVEKARALLSHFGSPQAIFNASPTEIASVPGLGEKTALKIKNVLLSGRR